MRHDYAAANAEWATKEAQYISDLRQSKKALETNGLRLQSVEKQLARHVSDSERRAVGLTSDLAAAQEEAAALRARNANQEEGPWMWVAVRVGWMWVAGVAGVDVGGRGGWKTGFVFYYLFHFILLIYSCCASFGLVASLTPQKLQS